MIIFMSLKMITAKFMDYDNCKMIITTLILKSTSHLKAT